jgi:hypothetical protein
MPVVINDFQVVTPSAGEPSSEGTPAGAGAAGPGTDAEETINRVYEELRTRRERKERLRAT